MKWKDSYLRLIVLLVASLYISVCLLIPYKQDIPSDFIKLVGGIFVFEAINYGIEIILKIVQDKKRKHETK